MKTKQLLINAFLVVILLAVTTPVFAHDATLAGLNLYLCGDPVGQYESITFQVYTCNTSLKTSSGTGIFVPLQMGLGGLNLRGVDRPFRGLRNADVLSECW